MMVLAEYAKNEPSGVVVISNGTVYSIGIKTGGGSSPQVEDPWVTWNRMRTLCEHQTNIGVALGKGPALPCLPAPSLSPLSFCVSVCLWLCIL